MKKCLLVLLLLAAEALWASAHEKLETTIQKKEWPALAALFADDSHQQAAAYFQECRRAEFSLAQKNKLMFYARFREFAEIGEITFAFENGAYRQLSLKRNIKPLDFVEAFYSYAISDRSIRMGNAEIHFKKGILYQGMPMGNLFIFSGEWTFKVRPEDGEEQLTLLHLVRSETFEKDAQAGVFISDPSEMLSGLPEPVPVGELPDEDARLLYEIFRKRWGMQVPVFDEPWYFPFAADFNVALFFQKSGRSYFRYIFNPGGSPDTTLVLIPENKFYLNYNAVKGLKLTAQSREELEKLQLVLFCNPQYHFLAGTSVLKFREPANVRMLNLDPGLVVKSYGMEEQPELQLFQRDETYYLMGQGLEKFSFYYAGTIRPGEEGGELSSVSAKAGADGGRDPVFVFSRDQNFYPNPGLQFFKSRVKISLPSPMQCLASGSLRSQQKIDDRNVFVYDSPGTKGVSFVCGNFRKLLTIPSRLPIQVYGNAKLRLADFLSAAEIKHAFNFLLEKFGLLEVSEVNLLLRRYQEYGGWSNQGLVVFNLIDGSTRAKALSGGRRILRDSPVVFTEVHRDSLVHELAHQWWGGVISWKSFQDLWLTEGLAQFSTLFYLQSVLSESQFRKVASGAKKWVFRMNDIGPIVYGRRIANLSQDLDTYQSIVYNKAAFVFLMLKEMLGEEEMLLRLRQILAELKYQSLTTARFILQFSQGSQRLRKFFNGWIYRRRLPEVRYQVAISGPEAEITFSQKDTDFVFPVTVRTTTAAGKSVRTLVIEEKVQKFRITENVPIQSIAVEALVSPIDLSD